MFEKLLKRLFKNKIKKICEESLPTPEPEPEPIIPNSNYLWLLDPGHGGMIDGEYQTAGKRSPIWDNGTQYFEGVGNRLIVDLILEKLTQQGIRCYDVVSSEEDVSLSERVKRANEADKTEKVIYVSIHSDAFSSESANGYSVYTSIGETKSDKVATIFLDNMKVEFPDHKLRRDTTDGDEDKESNFYVLKNTTSPAILIENFFMTNYRECQLLLDSTFREKLADCHVKSILYIDKNNTIG